MTRWGQEKAKEGTAVVITRYPEVKPAVKPEPVKHYTIFNCEEADLEREMNERDPEGKFSFQCLIVRGSSFKMVVKK